MGDWLNGIDEEGRVDAWLFLENPVGGLSELRVLESILRDEVDRVEWNLYWPLIRIEKWLETTRKKRDLSNLEFLKRSEVPEIGVKAKDRQIPKSCEVSKSCDDPTEGVPYGIHLVVHGDVSLEENWKLFCLVFLFSTVFTDLIILLHDSEGDFVSNTFAPTDFNCGAPSLSAGFGTRTEGTRAEGTRAEGEAKGKAYEASPRQGKSSSRDPTKPKWSPCYHFIKGGKIRFISTLSEDLPDLRSFLRMASFSRDPSERIGALPEPLLKRVCPLYKLFPTLFPNFQPSAVQERVFMKYFGIQHFYITVSQDVARILVHSPHLAGPALILWIADDSNKPKIVDETTQDRRKALDDLFPCPPISWTLPKDKKGVTLPIPLSTMLAVQAQAFRDRLPPAEYLLRNWGQAGVHWRDQAWKPVPETASESTASESTDEVKNARASRLLGAKISWGLKTLTEENSRGALSTHFEETGMLRRITVAQLAEACCKMQSLNPGICEMESKEFLIGALKESQWTDSVFQLTERMVEERNSAQKSLTDIWKLANNKAVDGTTATGAAVDGTTATGAAVTDATATGAAVEDRMSLLWTLKSTSEGWRSAAYHALLLRFLVARLAVYLNSGSVLSLNKWVEAENRMDLAGNIYTADIPPEVLSSARLILGRILISCANGAKPDAEDHTLPTAQWLSEVKDARSIAELELEIDDKEMEALLDVIGVGDGASLAGILGVGDQMLGEGFEKELAEALCFSASEATRGMSFGAEADEDFEAEFAKVGLEGILDDESDFLDSDESEEGDEDWNEGLMWADHIRDKMVDKKIKSQVPDRELVNPEKSRRSKALQNLLASTNVSDRIVGPASILIQELNQK